MALTIDEAIADVADDIGTTSLSPGPDTLPRMAIWVDLMFTNIGAPTSTLAPLFRDPWRRENMDQRSVYSWVAPTLIAQQKMILAGESQFAANLAIDVVLRALLATKFAFANLRISANQENGILSAYNAAW